MSEPSYNDLGQPVGEALPNWSPPPLPSWRTLAGDYVRLEPLRVEAHGDALFSAYAEDSDGRGWSYLPDGPFTDSAAFHAWLRARACSEDPLFFTLVDAQRELIGGVASYLRIAPEAGSIEIGHIHLAPALRGTRVATEGLYLLMAHAFDLGYRRLEWKCDALNAASCRAARRLGFVFEGVFRQATIYKGRSRDTAWYAVIDKEWPSLDAAFKRWLAAANFDADGNQREALSALMAQQNRSAP